MTTPNTPAPDHFETCSPIDGAEARRISEAIVGHPTTQTANQEVHRAFEMCYGLDANDLANSTDLSHFINGWRACLISQLRAPVDADTLVYSTPQTKGLDVWHQLHTAAPVQQDFVATELRGIIEVCGDSPTAIVSIERMRLWLSKLRAPVAGEAQPVADAWWAGIIWRPGADIPERPIPLYAAPQASEAVRDAALERAKSLREVACKKCGQQVISSCGGDGCPIKDRYADLYALPAHRQRSNQNRNDPK